MRLNKDDIYSLIGTVAFHGVILLILWFTVLKTEVPDEDGGVLVNFGNVDAAAGMFEPSIPGKNRLRKRPLPSSRTGAASGNAQAGTHHSRYRGKRSP